MTQGELAAALSQWFIEHPAPRWHRNPVGVVLKTSLQRAGHWKNAPRGDPAKGYNAARSLQDAR